MTVVRRGLLDTSVFIARESGRVLLEDDVPDEVYVSAVTVAELHAGAYAASTTLSRARRTRTL